MTLQVKLHVARALEALALGSQGEAEPVPPADLGRQQQEVRHLLHDAVGSTTGPKALDTIERLIGRRTLIVHLSAVELVKLRRGLEGERDGHLAEGAGAPSAAAPGEETSTKGDE